LRAMKILKKYRIGNMQILKKYRIGNMQRGSD